MTRLTASRTPSLEEVIRAALDAQVLDIHTALPARVEKYDPLTQKIDAKPLLKSTVLHEDGQEISESLPVIPDVPVLWPRGGGFFLSLPLAPGDLVLLVFAERSIDKWSSSQGEETDPIDLRDHDLSDAVALPGFYPFPRALPDAHSSNAVIGKELGTQIHVKDGEIALSKENPTDWVALANLVKTEIQALANSFNSHSHVTTATVSTGSPGVIAPIAPPHPPVNDVKSNIVKSD